MKNLRILFMGTPDFAVHILDQILASGKEVVGVVTAPDKPAGRGQKMHASAVKKYALEKNLAVYQPTNLKSEEFQKDLQALNPDIAVVVAFRMLPEKVWSFPKYGTFNLHASLLPQYRGAAPINWAIINGEEKTGVTTFFLDHKIDTGEIILQKQVNILPDQTAGELHDQLMKKGAQLVNETLDLIAKEAIQPQKQVHTGELKEAPKLNANNTQIDWSQSGINIKNLVRGLNPYPIAWTNFSNGDQELRCKIFEVKTEIAVHKDEIGKVWISKNEFRVSVTDGYVYILEMQLPGKRKMKIKDILNGLQIEDHAIML